MTPGRPPGNGLPGAWCRVASLFAKGSQWPWTGTHRNSRRPCLLAAMYLAVPRRRDPVAWRPGRARPPGEPGPGG